MNRRNYLTLITSAGVTSIAGCTAEQPPEPSSDDPAPPDISDSADGNPEDYDANIDDETVLELGLQTQKAVVDITYGRGGGTGWLIDDTTIVTNSHVIQAAEDHDINIELYSGETITGTIRGYVDDMIPDIGALAVDLPDAADYNTLTPGDATTLKPEDPLIQVGHPSGIGRWAISVGVLHAKHGRDTLLSTVPSLSGNSGSPIVNTDGNVVGLTSGGTRVRDPIDYRDTDEIFRDYPTVQWTTHNPIGTVTDHLDNW
ncbi:S1 family peptidase [Natrinema salaciae]|uniref:Serine protease Do n=1 Tax=Natrinema salaciae TaxID=1186196 RepID=A0A1H9PP43_9EURY|nr:serine protease [Natrinema salaciae]SER49917.1 serine protease Do [Natrinema salaciae]